MWITIEREVFEALQDTDNEEYEGFDDDFITGMLNEGMPAIVKAEPEKKEKKTVSFEPKKKHNMMVVDEESEGENDGVEIVRDEIQE